MHMWGDVLLTHCFDILSVVRQLYLKLGHEFLFMLLHGAGSLAIMDLHLTC